MLRSGDIVLTSLKPEDSDALFRWINDRETVLFNAPFRPIGRAAHDEWFRSVQQRPDVVLFAIRIAEPDRLIGTCQLRDIDPVHRGAELVIRIGEPEARGCGYGTEAVRLLVEFGFGELNLHRISLHVFDDNERARSVYRKVGFVEEGLLREAAFIDGRYRSVRVMGVLEDEYDRRDPPA